MNTKSRINCLGMSCLVLLLASALPASATTYYVDDDAPGGIGTSWATAFNDFQDALNIVGDGDEVRVAGGRYVPSVRTEGAVDRSETFWLKDGVEYLGGYRGLAGGGGSEDDRDPDQWESILDGDRLGDDGPDFANRDDNCYHVINATETWSETLIDGFTIRGGKADNNSGYPGYHYGGGGIKMYEGGAPRIHDCIFRENSAGDGGAILAKIADPVITECTFDGNRASGGGAIKNSYTAASEIRDCVFTNNDGPGIGETAGAILNIHEATPIIADCDFIGNVGSGAAAIRNTDSYPTIERCIFDSNEVQSFGGAVWHYEGWYADGTATMTDCTFTNNSAEQDGGGMYIIGEGSDIVVTRCSFEGNHTTFGMGGGLVVDNGNPTLIDCEFVGNSVERPGFDDARGGGVWVTGDIADPSFYNCLFAGNIADYGGGINIWRGYSGGISGRLVNCVLTGNIARVAGGACYLYGPGTPLISNCTLSANSAPQARSLYCDSINHNNPSTVTINNSILWNDGDEIVIADGSMVNISYSNVFDGWPGTGNIDALPHLADADGPDDIVGTVDDDVHLAIGSLCVDAGNSLIVAEDLADLDGDLDKAEKVPFDKDSNPRIIDAANYADTGVPDINGDVVDMGAYEVPVDLPTPDLPPGDMDGSGSLDALDTPVLVIALVDPVQYVHIYGIDIRVGDMDEDGDTDGDDIQLFIELLLGD